MKKILKVNLFLFCAGLALLAGACAQEETEKEVVVVGNPVDVKDLSGQNLTAFHLEAAAQNYSLCIACHGDKSDETALWNPTYAQPHKIHAERTRLLCTDCHVSVDLLQGSGAQLRHQVATETCAGCHGDRIFPGL